MISDRPPLPANLEVSIKDNEVIIEPGLVHGARGFTISLSREAASILGHKLIRAATQLLPPTTNNGGM